MATRAVRKLTSRDTFRLGALRPAFGGVELARFVAIGRGFDRCDTSSTVKRSTLADANASRPAAIFTGLFSKLMKQAHRGLRRSLIEETVLSDRILKEPSPDRVEQGLGALFVWRLRREGARHLRRGCGLPRLHGGERRQCERHFGRPGDAHRGGRELTCSTYGYYDYSIKARYRTPCYLSAWAGLDAAGCRIVTRFKSNTPLRVIEDRAVAEDGADSVRPHRLSARPSSKGPQGISFGDPVREVRVRIETGKIRILIKRTSTPAPKRSPRSTSAAGMIELFFRWIKQTLKIKDEFLGTSENAIRIQIAVSSHRISASHRLAHAAQKGGLTLLAFTTIGAVEPHAP